MPEHVIKRTAEALNAQRKPVNGSCVLVLGLAYKPNVDDDRESPSYVLMDLLGERGADVAYYDPGTCRPSSRRANIRTGRGRGPSAGTRKRCRDSTR